MNRRLSVRAIIVYKGKLFCVRQKNYRTGEPKGYLCTPGGGVDGGESLQTALIREMLEETGVAPVVGDLLYIQQFIDTRDSEPEEYLDFFFHVTNTQDYLDVDISTTSHGSMELAEAGFFEASAANNVLPRLLHTVDLATVGQSHTPTLVISYLPDQT